MIDEEYVIENPKENGDVLYKADDYSKSQICGFSLAIREWVLSLQLEYQNFEKGESPGDYNGGDAYAFQINCDTPLNFTYMDVGNNNHYIEIKGKWYFITNHNGIPDFLYDN